MASTSSSRGQVQVLDEEPDVVGVTSAGGEDPHRQQVFGEAADNRSPGWSNTRGALVSPPGAT